MYRLTLLGSVGDSERNVKTQTKVEFGVILCVYKCG